MTKQEIKEEIRKNLFQYFGEQPEEVIELMYQEKKNKYGVCGSDDTAENSHAIDIASRKTGGRYSEEQLRKLLDDGVTLTINDGRDGKKYAYWLDDSDCWAVSLDGNETELTEAQIEELLS